jgi:catechol 2,3-dioxygenase-like lactoylglutathione lyase family enzyme
MKLNHLDLPVHDIAANVAFLERYFGLELRAHNPSPELAVLSDGHGFTLVLQRRETTGDIYRDNLHIGFLLDDAAAVERLQARARADGADVSDVIVNARGTLIFLVAPGGFRVEVACQHPRPSEPHLRTRTGP